MQFSLTTLVLALTASVVAMPAQDAGGNLNRRQSVGLGGACSSRDDCIGQLNCIGAGGIRICSRNLGLGQGCAQDADCNSNNCALSDNGSQGATGFECQE